MAKRSRETSFSPSAGELPTSDSNEIDSDSGPEHSSKYTLVDSSPGARNTVMQCSLPPHREMLEFQCHEEYEVHYLKEHTNRCASCGRNFPTAHFLGLHIEENHNALREALQAKGEKTYACFVEDCDRKCSTPQKRRLHLIDKHGFPKFYNFRIVDGGIDRATSLLKEGQKRRVSLSKEANQFTGRRRRASSQAQAQAPTEVTKATTILDTPKESATPRTEPRQATVNGSSSVQQPNSVTREQVQTSSVSPNEIDNLEKSMSALRFVPTSVVLRNSKKC